MQRWSPQRRRLALFLLSFFVLALLLTHCFILTSMTHECLGPGCRICSMLRSAAVFLSQIKIGAYAVSIAGIALYCAACVVAAYRDQPVVVSTLIGIKVRLNS